MVLLSIQYASLWRAGEVDYIEFVAILASGHPSVTKNVTSHISNFEEVFKLFDREGDGFISFSEYCEGNKLLRINIGPSEAKRRFDEADTTGRGQINFSEFMNMAIAEDAPKLNGSLSVNTACA